ncbi:hypothetical protein KDX27_15820 [Burkholderia cenocepacia]|jgi:hypothetical protein|uniref:Uncharacterized protein n=1 Tax=Burkholderia cenocepacia TaxID=95486 RepID=A0ABD4U6Y7_9BURK|nr:MULTISPECIES: hypothetical protein [Burkholderia]AIO45291.1 hypothetical protein DM42_5969 [Burkholderia cepacia]KGC00047.1 hypothetical protein DM44_3866 [Burkholderia cepacia]MBG0868131.1 hypothetical protein [Burkholderia sp. 9779_493]MBN3528107.1 hypothetical protein [Burkholderia cenocepacia]MBO1857300.1 hypothetical protein [Burkholderia cenocepacia]
MKGESNGNEKMMRTFLPGSLVYICFNYYACNVPEGKLFSPDDRVGIFTDESNSFRISG